MNNLESLEFPGGESIANANKLEGITNVAKSDINNTPETQTNYSNSSHIYSHITQNSAGLLRSVENMPNINQPGLAMPPMVLYSIPETEEWKDVSEEFVTEFNKRRGNNEYHEIAMRMIKKTRILGGLHPTKKPKNGKIDIPSARKNFCILAGLDDFDLKMAALKNLIHLLEKDDLSKKSAFDLAPIAIHLMKKMDTELSQTELVDVQIKICRAYGMVTELLLRHYDRVHLSGITSKLKEQLKTNTKRLEDLNRKADVPLHFHIQYALEGILRLEDDSKPLFTLFKSGFNLFILAASLYFEDIYHFPDTFWDLLNDIDFSKTNAWYDAIFVINEKAKKAKADNLTLLIMQGLVHEKAKELNWKFLYQAISIFGDVVIQGTTQEIRKAALLGQEAGEAILSPKKGKIVYPGIITFLNCDMFHRHIDARPLQRMKLPKIVNSNFIIRKHCVETLIKISKKTPDQSLRKLAKNALIQHLHEEKEEAIKNLIATVVPDSPNRQTEWLNEEGEYVVILASHENQFDKIPSSPKLPVFSGSLQVFNSIMRTPSQIPSIASSPVVATSYQPIEQKSGRRNSIPKASSFKNGSPAILREKVDRPPNKIELLLSSILDIPVNKIQNRLKYKNDIFPDGEGLNIKIKGMEQIINLITSIPEITIVDFSKCKLEQGTIPLVAQAIEFSNITAIKLNSSLTEGDVEALANAIDTCRNLKVELGEEKNYLHLGICLAELGNFDKAIVLYNKAISDMPQQVHFSRILAKLHYRLGQAYQLNGTLDKAAEEFKIATNIDPTYLKP